MKGKKNSSKMEKARNSMDWETTKRSGFSPQWKPNKKGEDVIFLPLSARIIPVSKNMDNEGAGVECRLMGGSSDNFWMKDIKQGVSNGENFSIGLSYALTGDDGLAVHEVGTKKKKGTARLSLLSQYHLSNKIPMRIIFEGQIKNGKRKLNVFNIQSPSGTLEAMAAKSTKK